MTPFERGEKAFNNGYTIHRARDVVDAVERDQWRKGYLKAQSSASEVDRRICNALLSIKEHVVKNGSVYLFLTQKKRFVARSKQPSTIESWLERRGVIFVGCYQRPLIHKDILDDMREALKELEPA